jgi:tetratricopeptide (TPR) repeat protein
MQNNKPPGDRESMNISVCLIALALFPVHTTAQSEPPIKRHDSATVSAGIPKEQLALEDQLNEIISKGNQALKKGNTGDAVRQYESALDLVRKQPLLAERKNYVLDTLANGYVWDNRAKDAIPIYSQLVTERKRDCEAESAAVSNCADVQNKLGLAQMHAGEFQAALDSFRKAEANYAKAEKFSDSHEFAVIEVKEQAQTNLWVAVALFQLGKTAEATTIVETLISQLARVKSDESINIGIRDDADRSLQEAQTFLKRLKAAQ